MGSKLSRRSTLLCDTGRTIPCRPGFYFINLTVDFPLKKLRKSCNPLSKSMGLYVT